MPREYQCKGTVPFYGHRLPYTFILNQGKGAMLTYWIHGVDDGTDSLSSANLEFSTKTKIITTQKSKESGVKRILSPLQNMNSKNEQEKTQLPGSVDFI